VVAVVTRLAERQQLLLGDATSFRPLAEVLADQIDVEGLVPGRYGRMRGEQRVSGDVAQRGGDRLGIPLPQLATPLERQEGGVALVDVPGRRLDPQRFERAGAADAEQDLLAEAHLAAAHVERRGDRAIRRMVDRQVGVEQQHRDASDLGPPDPGVDHPFRELDGDVHLPAVAVQHRQQRQPVQVVVGVVVLLQPLGVEALLEVAVLVHQPDAEEGEPQVARRLAVVAGEDAQAARVDLQALVPAELGAEIGEGTAAVAGVLPLEPGRLRRLDVGVELGDERVVVAGELLVLFQRLPAVGVQVDQHVDRVAVVTPGRGGEPVEEAVGRRRPGPPQVVDDVAQPTVEVRNLQIRRRGGADLGPQDGASGSGLVHRAVK
jgi:hypothetical protein